MVCALAVIAGFLPGRTLCRRCFMWLAAKFTFLQDTETIFLLSFNSIVCFFWCCASILSIGYPSLGGLISFLAREVISKAWQISLAFFKSRFDSRSNNSCSLPETPKTILSQINCSFSLKLHEAAREYNSVRNTSKGSWNRYVPEKKTLKNFVFSQFTVLFKLFEDLRWIVFSSSPSKWTWS